MTDTTAAGASATFTITRTLHAPRDVVWRAWTDEDELARWLYDFGRTPRESISFDVREGGSYRYTLISDNGEEYPTGGVFLEVVPPERLVFTWGNPDDSIDTAPVVTITLTERDGRTELVFSPAWHRRPSWRRQCVRRLGPGARQPASAVVAR